MPSICQCCHVFFLIIHVIKVANSRMCVCVLGGKPAEGAVLTLLLALFFQELLQEERVEVHPLWVRSVYQGLVCT